MNERRDLPVVGNAGGINRVNPGAEAAARPAAGVAPPGTALRDPRYQDLCTFFGGYPDGQAWEPAVGDWVYLAATRQIALVIGVESGEGDAGSSMRVVGADSTALPAQARGECVWLPTLSQLRVLLHDAYGSVGFFTSVFTDTTYWYQGELSGMEVEKMTPLAEGSSPEEAAVKALLMRFQR